jgi:hypothetical protein
MGFFSPTAHAASKVHFTQGFTCPLRSGLRVWLPSRRFTPFETWPALFHAGSALGKVSSELSPPERCPDVSTRANSLTVSPSGFSAAQVRRPGPMVLRLLSFDPLKSPLPTGTCLACPQPDAPLRFAPLGFFRSNLARISPDILSCAWVTRLASRDLHSRVSISCRPYSSVACLRRYRTNRPFWGSCAGCHPVHSTLDASGLWVRRSRS